MKENTMNSCRDCYRSVILATFDRTRDPASGNVYESRIVACDWGGYWHVDFRLFFLAQDGIWRATKRGASIRVAEIDEVIEALIQAKKVIGEEPAP
jgi:hypothetical protein